MQIKNSDGHYSQDDILACSLGTELNKKTIFYGLRSTKESVKSYRIVNINDVIYTKSPIKGYPNGIVRTSKIVDGIVPSLYCVYQKKRDISMAIDTRFIQSYLEDKNRLDYYLFPLVNVGARNNVNITDKEFLKGIIKIPICIEEQIQIVEMLEKVNHLITLHQRKLDKLINVKKSMLEKMFPKQGSTVPEIRFSGFTNDWEQRKVSDMFKVTRGYVLATTLTNNKKSDEMPYPVYSSQTKDFGLMGYYWDYLYEDAITWTTDGANAGTVNYRAGKFYCTNVCGVLLSDKISASQMVAEALNNVAKGYVSYVGNPKLMNNVMSDIEIMIPVSSIEQKRISDYFATLDNLITLHQRLNASYLGI